VRACVCVCVCVCACVCLCVRWTCCLRVWLYKRSKTTRTSETRCYSRTWTCAVSAASTVRRHQQSCSIHHHSIAVSTFHSWHTFSTVYYHTLCSACHTVPCNKIHVSQKTKSTSFSGFSGTFLQTLYLEKFRDGS